ncbi:hypothetical protein BDZ97DRAFT_2013363 [Flammula alnicola]|nr:hypothetical protein BDZ97DRAFT_2013363 [Flammula alnicola]
MSRIHIMMVRIPLSNKNIMKDSVLFQDSAIVRRPVQAAPFLRDFRDRAVGNVKLGNNYRVGSSESGKTGRAYEALYSSLEEIKVRALTIIAQELRNLTLQMFMKPEQELVRGVYERWFEIRGFPEHYGLKTMLRRMSRTRQNSESFLSITSGSSASAKDYRKSQIAVIADRAVHGIANLRHCCRGYPRRPETCGA